MYLAKLQLSKPSFSGLPLLLQSNSLLLQNAHSFFLTSGCELPLHGWFPGTSSNNKETSQNLRNMVSRPT